MIITLAQTNRQPEIQHFRYSVHQSQRQSAYPGEIVVFSCRIFGNRLSWDIRTNNSREPDSIHSFIPGSSLNSEGFTTHKNVKNGVKYNFTGGLDFGNPSNNASTLCQSTMAVIPTGNYSDVSFNITCMAIIDQSNAEETITYSVSTEAYDCTGYCNYYGIIVYIITIVS